MAFSGGLTATLSGGEFLDNNATNVIAVFAGTTLNILNKTTVARNHVARGSLYASWQSELYVTDGVSLVNNVLTASDSKWGFGGAMYVVGATVSVRDSVLSNNTAGDTLYTEDVGGAAVYAELSDVQFRDCNVTNNSAQNGGALRVEKQSMFRIVDSRLAENTATDAGGAVYARNSTITVTASNLTSNTAPVGAAIYVRESSILVVNGSTIIGDNHARSVGRQAVKEVSEDYYMVLAVACSARHHMCPSMTAALSTTQPLWMAVRASHSGRLYFVVDEATSCIASCALLRE